MLGRVERAAVVNRVFRGLSNWVLCEQRPEEGGESPVAGWEMSISGTRQECRHTPIDAKLYSWI